MTNRSRAHPALNPEGPSKTPPRWRTRLGWRIGIAIIAPAAAGIVAWSLYVVAHDMYGVPKGLAVLVAACFDGTAIACLYLASEAVRENRSAFGPRLATLLLAAISMYLNRLHAVHINGGMGATLLFAAPTGALLLLADLSWSATRARHRIARGERPMRLPVFGWLGWLLASEQAWDATKQRAVEHVTGKSAESDLAPAAAAREPGELLASELADLPPTKAIRIIREARPELTPAQLAEVLRQYGQEVTELDVAIVLDRLPRPAEVTLTRADAGPQHSQAPAPHHLVITVKQPEAITAAAGPTPPPEQDAEATPAPDGPPAGSKRQPGLDEQRRTERIVDDALAGAGSKADAVRLVQQTLPGLSSKQVATHLHRHGVNTTDSYVRTVLSRDRKPKPKAPAEQTLDRRSTGPYL